MSAVTIRLLSKQDIAPISEAFAAANWPKPKSLYEGYLAEQQQHHRIVWLAFYNEQFAGYVTLRWISDYAYFRAENIPEIKDFNVLPQLRNLGIGSQLLNVAENAARQKSLAVGLSVGLYADYGAAQRMYIKRGYIPDGRGISYGPDTVAPGTNVCLDDDLVLWLVKRF